jgi:hypothetical protein
LDTLNTHTHTKIVQCQNYKNLLEIINHLKFTEIEIAFCLEDIVPNDGHIICYVTRKMNLLQNFSTSSAGANFSNKPRVVALYT